MVVFNIDKARIYEQLKILEKTLHSSFPYDDTDKIQNDFNKKLSEENCLTGDLNSYWMNIDGSLSYILRGRSIPEGQIDWLHSSFFDIFHQYRFLEEKMADYPTFYEEYTHFEKVRNLLLDYLSYN